MHEATVNDACKQLDFAMDEVIKGLDSLSNMYMKGDEFEKSKIVISEREKIELEYKKTTEDACAYLNDLRSETARQVSKALSQDTVSKLYISRDRPASHETVRQNDKFPSMWRKRAGFDGQNDCGREAPNASNNKDECEEGNTIISGIDHTLGQDLWRQLKRVEIPVFDGN
ncbi:hypothetical protein DPMN_112963 [Dreissena polymorpha]|uniref:Uncharacterized protein n=1 Tax=Dreissena polymorpha TaxID=45954 RepID=A0A9D4KI47_DREPO|nr:hypothetical protein DPMN_112963 [Dreissena polymorpha]